MAEPGLEMRPVCISVPYTISTISQDLLKQKHTKERKTKVVSAESHAVHIDIKVHRTILLLSYADV